MHTRSRRPTLTTVLVASVLLVSVPGLATTTQDELDAAAAELEAGLARLEEASAAIEGAEQRAAVAAAGLADVERDLADAAAAAGAATDAAEEASAALEAAIRSLADDEAELLAAQQTVDDRAAALWMRGSATDQALVAGVLGSGELHDVFVRVHAVGRIAETDAARLATSADLVLVAALDRDALGRIRSRASEATGRAVRARDDAAALVVRQEGLVADAARAAEERRVALARLEQDVAARAALVVTLEERLLTERLGELEDWLADPANVPPDAPSPPWAGALPSSGRTIAPAIVHGAASGGVDPRLLAALVWTESSFDPAAVSPSGAIGLTQLLPSTARGLGVDPWDPLDNLRGGARYLRTQLDRFERVDLALAAYNAGPGRVARAGGIPDIVETQLYVLRVLDRVERLGGVHDGGA